MLTIFTSGFGIAEAGWWDRLPGTGQVGGCIFFEAFTKEGGSVLASGGGGGKDRIAVLSGS